ncbi:MAG TPA: zinc-binding dehydrogenase [Actinocrinis sp.]|nr:zinc-binding dehydrogenase [Actinocrinis sp.]
MAAEGGYGPIPAGLDPAAAVVLSTAVTGMSAKTAAGLIPGETVLVQGATGVTGRLAVKVARLLGAGRIVATGRNESALREVLDIGADVVINTAVSDEDLPQACREAKGDGYDVVLDYLWSRPTGILLRTLVPGSFSPGKPTRLVQIGEAAGPSLTVTADSLRTSGVEIYGASKGLTAETMGGRYTGRSWSGHSPAS